jgi:hypothetical protein
MSSTSRANSSPFVGFNKLPALPGNENVPPPPEMQRAARAGLYAAKCVPATTAVIARARRMRKNHPILRAIYLVTDGEAWADELTRWLLSDGWEAVYVASDVHGAWRDQEVRPMVDTEVARRAGVFVGNGVSWWARVGEWGWRWRWRRVTSPDCHVELTPVYDDGEQRRAAALARPCASRLDAVLVASRSLMHVGVSDTPRCCASCHTSMPAGMRHASCPAAT